MPLHSDGQETRKGLDALKEIPTTVSKANTLYNEQEHHLKVAPTTRDPPELHVHDQIIHQYNLDDMLKGYTIKCLLTSIENGHQHSVDIKMDSHGNYVVMFCDGMARCWDGHDMHFTLDH